MVDAVREFAGAVVTNWWALAGFVSAVLWVVSQASGKAEHANVPRRLWPALVLVFLFLGAFQAFYDKRGQAIKLEGYKRTAEGERDEARHQRDEAIAAADRLRSVPEQKELEALRARIGELERQQAPRRLTDEQQAVLLAVLKDNPPDGILIVSGSAEGDDYARFFVKVFVDAGWQVTSTQMILNPAVHDVQVHAVAGNQAAALVMRALTHAKVESVERVEVTEETATKEGALQLAIGPRKGVAVYRDYSRRLSVEQIDTIRRALLPFEGKYAVDLQILGEDDPESERYAADFSSLFQSLKWPVVIYPNQPLVAAYPGLFVHPVQATDPAASALLASLSGLGIRAKLVAMGEEDRRTHLDRGYAQHFHVVV